MKKILVFLLCIGVMPVCAAELNENSDCEASRVDVGVDKSSQAWFGKCDGIKISGDAVCSSLSGNAGDVKQTRPPVDVTENAADINKNCWCKMTSPYQGVYWVFTGYSTYSDQWDKAQKLCVNGDLTGRAACVYRCGHLWNAAKMYENQEYAIHGFYTDENLLKVKRGLFASEVMETPCEIGISKLMVSTGDSFRLWAEQYTEHALVVQYNNEKCYIKLESGIGKLNVKYGTEIYHAVE